MTLHEWSDDQDKLIPKSCPKCSEPLPQIRYVHDKDTTNIHLTHATNIYECYRAMCPHCDHILSEHGISTRHIR